MLEEIFHDSLKISKYKDLYGRPCKRDWMANVVFLIQQMLLTFGGRCNRGTSLKVRLEAVKISLPYLPSFCFLVQLIVLL